MVSEYQKELLRRAELKRPEYIRQIAFVACLVEDIDTLQYLLQEYLHHFDQEQESSMRKVIKIHEALMNEQSVTHDMIKRMN